MYKSLWVVSVYLLLRQYCHSTDCYAWMVWSQTNGYFLAILLSCRVLRGNKNGVNSVWSNSTSTAANSFTIPLRAEDWAGPSGWLSNSTVIHHPGCLGMDKRPLNGRSGRYTHACTLAFHSQILKIFFASGSKGALTPLIKILWTLLNVDNKLYEYYPSKILSQEIWLLHCSIASTADDCKSTTAIQPWVMSGNSIAEKCSNTADYSGNADKLI